MANHIPPFILDLFDNSGEPPSGSRQEQLVVELGKKLFFLAGKETIDGEFLRLVEKISATQPLLPYTHKALPFITALCASNGFYPETLHALVQLCKRNSVDWQILNGETPPLLSDAIQNRRLKVFDLLLKECAEVNYAFDPVEKDENGPVNTNWRSVFYALYDQEISRSKFDPFGRKIKYDREELLSYPLMAESLIEAGAKLDLKVGEFTAQDLAQKYPNHPASIVIMDHLGFEAKRGFLGRDKFKNKRTLG